MSAVALQRPRGVERVVRPVVVTESTAAASGRRTLILALSTASVIVAAVFGIVGFKAMAADAAVEARSLERSVAQSERLYAELIAAVAAKEDPARIRGLALELGLVPSPAARHLILSRGIDADGARLTDDSTAVLTDSLKPILTQGR